MDVELIKALANLPITAILIYLVIRLQAEKEKLLTSFIEGERCHAKDLVDIVLSGKIKSIAAPPPQVENLQSNN
jgi:hypothetical protein